MVGSTILVGREPDAYICDVLARFAEPADAPLNP